MKIFLPCILLLVLLLMRAQSGQPLPPELEAVSVDTATGNVIIEWSDSPSSGLDDIRIYYGIEDQVIIGGDTVTRLAGVVIDSIDHTNNSYIHVPDDEAGTDSWYAVDVTRGIPVYSSSLISNFHRAVQLNVHYDSCLRQMELEWSPYEDWGDELRFYNVYFSNDGDIYNLKARLDQDENGFIHTQLQLDENYCYFIETERSDGLLSTSAIKCKFAQGDQPPDYINADYATVSEGNRVDLSFSMDPMGEINRFGLLRSLEKDAGYIEIARLEEDGSRIMTSNNTDDATNNYYYKLAALNSCLVQEQLSNVASNIVIQAELDKPLVQLSWSAYVDWRGGVDTYDLYRVIQGTGRKQLARLDSLTTGYTDTISNLAGQEIFGQICYYVKATEGDANPYGVKGVSRSNIACIEVLPDIFMPNAFTPNQDGLNDELKPILTFIPADYLFIVYNRLGQKVFETNRPDEAWNGTTNNGNKGPRGTYMYYIKISSSSGYTVEKSGQIHLIYP